MNLPTTMIEKPEKPFYGAEYRDYSQGLNFQFLYYNFIYRKYYISVKILNHVISDSDYESAVTDLGNQALESIDGMIADLEL